VNSNTKNNIIMAKKTTKAKVEKLSSEELKNIQELQGKIQNIVMNLGSAELARQSMINEHSLLNEEWKKITLDLETKYGQVNVNLADGVLSPIKDPVEKEPEVLQAVVTEG
jgi:hypothetical protein|tara:strand:+ start:643 stop:975 length:333 start_codon:yes stop_codon:yes gene_type:complete